jgi:hypothetical protein
VATAADDGHSANGSSRPTAPVVNGRYGQASDEE